MQAVGADPDFGTETVFETIGEAGRGIVQHRGRIDAVEEDQSSFAVFADDGVGVAAAVGIDMSYGLVEAGNHLHR